jgi:hypothetical protein
MAPPWRNTVHQRKEPQKVLKEKGKIFHLRQALGLFEYIVSPGTLYAVRIVSHVQESVPKQIVRYISHLKLSNYKASFVSREHDLYNRITPIHES